MRSLAAFGFAAVLYTALTTALTWPLILSPARSVPNDLGDPLLNTYLLAWNARSVPLTEHWWSVPQFYPQRGATAYSEHLLGLSPISTPIIWVTGSPLLAYNAAFFLSFVLCGLSAHVLAYVLTRRHDVSVLAGLAFAFAPYRMSQVAHLQVLSAYWMPLALAGLHLYFADRRARWLVLFGGAWLMQALSCGYYLFYLSALVGLWLLWFGIGRERWSDVLRVTGVWVLAGVAMSPIAWGYLKHQQAAGLRRWPDEIEAFSADVASVLKAPDSLWLWGWLDVVGRPESAIFPGLTVVVLVLVGSVVAWMEARRRSSDGWVTVSRLLLVGAAVFAAIAATPSFTGPWKFEPFGVRLLSVTTARKPFSVAVLLTAAGLLMHPAVIATWRRRSALAFYALATVAMWVFCLGPSPTLMNKPLIYKAPYAWLMLIPGVDGVRVPARFWVLGTLCLAIAAALAVAHITRRWPSAGRWVPIAASGFILLDAWPRLIPVIQAPDARPVHVPAVARLELPVNPAHDAIVLYRAAEHRRPVINGYSGYFAPQYWALQYLLEERDPAILARLSMMGPIEVVIDHDIDRDRSWRRFVGSQPDASVAYEDQSYTAYRLARTEASASMLPQIKGEPLRFARATASLYQDLVGQMTDGDRLTRWHTGGPQDPTNELTIDLGTTRHVTAVEQQIAGYIQDFPRVLNVDTSVDGSSWSTAWTGGTALLVFSAALEEPLTVPLRSTFEPRPARYVRLRQTGSDPIYYWSIAELRIFGVAARVEP